MGGPPVVRMLKVPLYHSMDSRVDHFSKFIPPLSPPQEEGDHPETSDSQHRGDAEAMSSPPVWITWIWIQVISYGDRFFWFHITEGAPPCFSRIGPCAMATPPFTASREDEEGGEDAHRTRRVATKDIPTTLLSGGGVDGGGLGENLGVDTTSTPGGIASVGGLAPPFMDAHGAGMPHAAMASLFSGMHHSSGCGGPNEMTIECPEQTFCMSLARRLVYRMSKKEEEEEEKKEKDKVPPPIATPTALDERLPEESNKAPAGVAVPGTGDAWFSEATTTAMQVPTPPHPTTPEDPYSSSRSGKKETKGGRRGGRGDVVVVVNLSVSPEKKPLLLSTGVGAGLLFSIEFGNVVYKECLRCIQDLRYGLMNA